MDWWAAMCRSTLDPVVRVALVFSAEIGEYGAMGHGFIKSTIKVLAEAGYRSPRQMSRRFSLLTAIRRGSQQKRANSPSASKMGIA